MKFGEFLRTCRQNAHMTQEQLVEGLYLFDAVLFSGLDTTTLSKWERSITQPKASKKVSILRFFQEHFHEVLPCFSDISTPENETHLCQMMIKKLILGKTKDIIMNFPSHMMTPEHLSLTHVRHLKEPHTFLEVAADLRNSVHPSLTQIDTEHLYRWSLHPSSFFITAQYKGFIIGFLFALRVKKHVSRSLLHFEMPFNQLTDEDFASFQECGSHIITHFFAWNEKAATMLMLRFYAHLITHRQQIDQIGAAVYYDDAKTILGNMNIDPLTTYHEDGIKIISYRSSIQKVLLNEHVVKILFQKDNCPQEL